MNWLDTQTKEILQKGYDPKLSPPKVAEFALVLVRKGQEHDRMVHAIREINHCSEADAVDLLKRPTPVTINRDLTEEDALWGQFALICCDAISLFIRSEVLEQNGRAYLESLFNTVLHSAEFRATKVSIAQVPNNEDGEKFIDQFLGRSFTPEVLPVALEVPFKKARIMNHWAARVGAKVEVGATRDT